MNIAEDLLELQKKINNRSDKPWKGCIDVKRRLTRTKDDVLDEISARLELKE